MKWFALFDFLGVPPLLSRRVLETLTYLARNHPHVARIMLQVKLPHNAVREADPDTRGKSVAIVEDEGYISIAMLISLLNQPLYLRSIAHLEQVINYFCVVFQHHYNHFVPFDCGVRS